MLRHKLAQPFYVFKIYVFKTYVFKIFTARCSFEWF